MSLNRIQTCENCGAKRVLSENQNPHDKGWRTLTAVGNLEATLCNECVLKIVTVALNNAQARNPKEED